ncbi:alkaline phosphatase family protein [Stakelama sediminis]|uniref:Phospholipase C n=1 Tax=Stakelama sediminis TaxID=463200 RepID=A0A840Z0U1_9SPHN|nr:alkaline phosphatase family protein [Stakelama sediminis]MBB5719322.1 phospholipase C [Stakelama sediminis]
MFRSSARLAAFALTSLALTGVASAGQPQKPHKTATPIKHLVVIFQENASFDHYFGTYPVAANPSGEVAFHARPGTPGLPGADAVNTLASAHLLHDNPNATNPENGDNASGPFRLDVTQAATQSQNHGYTAEQAAFDGFKMDLFPKYTGRASPGGVGAFGTKGQVMGYFDGNTVTALWNYAQHYAMSDNSFGTTFGPSTIGAINLVSGQTNGAVVKPGTDPQAAKHFVAPDGNGGLTLISDADPAGDVCSTSPVQVTMTGPNIGDMMNAHHLSWGWFEGGFDRTYVAANGSKGCKRFTRSAVTGVPSADYIPHHEPFQYYASTANPQHVRPSSVAAIGTAHDGGANHQYDIRDFFAVLKTGRLPAVSFLKARAFEDGHPGYSDPVDEQHFLTRTINAIQQSPLWKDTAIIVLWDDSDGWYDHAHAVMNASHVPGYDVLEGDHCGTGTPLPGVDGKPAGGRCGHGARQPFLLISPYAKQNYVDHTLTDQTSVLRFIEDNWMGGARLGKGSYDAHSGSIDGLFAWHGAKAPKLLLDPKTGTPR